MPVLVRQPTLEQELIDDRRAQGLDRWDEVWEGTYIIMPLANNEHQELVFDICSVLKEVVRDTGRGRVFPGCNVSDRGLEWEHNFRCPDVAVYLRGNPAIDFSTHWHGGPDLAIEIVSPGDASHEKLDFYSAVGTREVLIIDRDPWRLELYRAADGELSPVPANQPIVTETVGLQWSLGEAADGAMTLRLADAGSDKEWSLSAL